MNTHDARSIITEFIGRCNEATEAAYELLSEDVIVTVNGTTPLSGRFPGLRVVKGILVDTARVVIARVKLTILEFVGAGYRVAVVLLVSGEAVDGECFNDEGRACGCVFTVDKGLITEILFFPDTSLIELVLYKRLFVPN